MPRNDEPDQPIVVVMWNASAGGQQAPVSIGTFQEPVVLDVLLRVVLRTRLKFAEFCAAVKPVKPAEARREDNCIV